MTGPGPQQYSLLNDEPVDDPGADVLGVSRAAEHLAGLLVASRGLTPFVLAVEAGWGTGKSTLMRLVDAELQKAGGVHTVWYNAWTSSGPDALEGLIKSILMRFDRRGLRRALRRFTERRTLLTVARTASTVAAGWLGASGLADELWKVMSADPQARNEMRGAIKDLAREWAERGDGPDRRLLVVFVDDLDRCSEETVLAVCEAVKIYLDVPGLAFVVGCDRSALGSSGLLRDLSPAGSAFMEKIFQTSYRMPVPDRAAVEEFIRRCAWDSGIHTLLNADLVTLIADRSGHNPRRIKKLVNGFVLEIALNPVWRDFGPQAVDAIIRSLLLQHLYPDFYRMMVGASAAYGDVLGEFVTYRHVRRSLRQITDENSGEADVARFFTEHDLRPPNRDDPAGWANALADLESHLPSGFPALASDRGFTSLIDDLLELPQAEDLIQRLRQQPFPRSSEALAHQGTVSYTSDVVPPVPRGTPDEQLLAGVRILWIDDDPESVDLDARAMRQAGAQVSVVASGAEAERHLATVTPDLLISDITRGTDQQAGFTDVERLRSNGSYTGPVVFYTRRITPAREARASALGALGITVSPDQLRRLTVRAARLRVFDDRRTSVPPADC